MGALKDSPCAISHIGRIEAEAGIRLLDENNNPVSLPGSKGFEHFSGKRSL